MLLDIRYALRRIRKDVGFSLAVILVIGLAVGSNTTIFTLCNSLLLMKLPGVAAVGELVEIGRTQNGEGMDTESYPDYLTYRQQNATLESMSAWTPASLNFNQGGDALRILGCLVSGNYFSTLGARPYLGRFFEPEEDRTPGTHPVLVASYEFWRQNLEEELKIVGETVKINGQDFTVIGVTEPGFFGTVSPLHPDLWIPLMMQATAIPGESDSARNSDQLSSRGSNWLFQFGRLRPGVGAAQAAADLENIAQRLEQAYPDANRGQGIAVEPLRSLPAVAVLPVTAIIGLLFAATGTLLAIACVNLAGLLLARLAGRRDELAVRFAVGSPRWRIARQLLTEITLLFSAGGLIGLLLATWFERLLRTFHPPTPLPLHLAGSWDYRVVLFGLLLSLACGLVFGVMPVRLATREALADLLRESRGGSRKISRLRDIFVTGQVALCLLLLFMAGLFLRSLQETASLDFGFDPENVWTAQVDLSLNGYNDTRSLEFFRRFLAAAQNRPGLESVALAADLPLDGSRLGLGGIASDEDREAFIGANFNIVSPGYLETLRIPLLGGRSFAAQDSFGSPGAVILNQTAADRLWPGQEATGKKLRIGDRDANREYRVIGVVASGRLTSLTDPSEPHAYLSLLQEPRSSVYLVIRAQTSPFLQSRQIIEEIDPSVPLVRPALLSEVNQAATLVQRVVGAVSGIVGLAALLLASVGVFAQSSYAAASRTREFGIRLALGAKPKQILSLVTQRGLAPAIGGAGIGIVLSLLMGNLVKGFLIGVGPGDLVAFLAASGVLLGVVAVAAFLPARRAAQLDPMKALRYE